MQIKRRMCISGKQSLTPSLGVLGLPEEHNKEEGHHKGLQPCCEASKRFQGLFFSQLHVSAGTWAKHIQQGLLCGWESWSTNSSTPALGYL